MVCMWCSNDSFRYGTERSLRPRESRESMADMTGLYRKEKLEEGK